MNTKSYIKENWVSLIFLVLSFIILGLFLSLSRYALPKTDDFSNIVMCSINFEGSHDASSAAWQTMKQIYMGQQGTYLSCFIAPFVLIRFGTVIPKFQLFIAVSLVFIFLGMLFLLRTLASYLHFNRIWGAFLFAILWIALDFTSPGEALLYIVGTAVYGIPIGLSCFSIGFFILLLQGKKKWWMAFCLLASSISGFLSCGGVLMVSALTNMLMVLLIIHNWFVEHRFPLRGVIPFLFAFGGALLNTLAPGNYVRYAGEGDSHMDVLGAIGNTFGVTNEQLGHLFSYTYFLVALLVIAILVLFSKKECNVEDYKVHPVFFFLGAYATAWIVIFPCVLGLRMVPHGYIQNRTIFTFGWSAALMFLTAWTHLMFYLRSKYVTKLAGNRVAIGIALGALVIGCACNVFYIPVARGGESQPTIAEICEEYSTDSINDYYTPYHLALIKAEKALPGHECIVFYEMPDSKLFFESHMSSDPAWWVNSTCATVYQLSQFAYLPEHEFTEADAAEAGYTLEQLLP